MTLFGKQSDQEDGRLVSENNHWHLDARFFYKSGMGEWRESKVKRPSVLQTSPRMHASGRRCVNFFLPAIHRWTGF